MRRFSAFSVCSALVIAAPVTAQVIDIKTVPIAVGEQFLIFPSRNLGFGSLSIAVRDPLLDHFINPAKAARLRTSHVFSAPAFYGVGNNGGSGRTIPAGAIFKSDYGFGGLMLAFQQLQPSDQNNFCCIGPLIDAIGSPVPNPNALSERSHTNQYAYGMFGRQLQGTGISLGGSAMYGALEAIDGIELLYPNSFSLQQGGHVADLRFGLLADRPNGRSLEAMFVFSTVDMGHDVTYVDFVWDPATSSGIQRQRDEHNTDRTRTYGLHFGLENPIAAKGWRTSTIFTANYKNHPKIPNYDLMAIPRDPGFSYAWNLGFGIGTDSGPAIIGIEAVLEPIVSHTWANAEGPVSLPSGSMLKAGDRTVENTFVFNNTHLRAGLQREIDLGPASEGQKLAIQMGLGMKSIRYRLNQKNILLGQRRFQREDWVEWTPSWGATLRFPDLEIRYVGRQTNGTGRPGVVGSGGVFADRGATALSSTTVLIAPTSALTLTESRVRTHQLSVTIPLP
jgi:hypothetical protein